MKILIVEDEVLLADSLKTLLEKKGFTVEVAYDGETGKDYAETGVYDLLILDVMMPKLDGYAVARAVRAKHCGTPILMLTARSGVEDRIAGLNAGADYYLTKPFDTRELLACMRALLRRTQEETPSAVMTLGDVTLDRESHRVTAGGQEIALTHMEFELLAFLMAHAGKAVTREVLLDDVWGIAYSGDTRTIDVHVRTLRQKLGDSGRLIATIRNVGYRMDEHPEAGES